MVEARLPEQPTGQVRFPAAAAAAAISVCNRRGVGAQDSISHLSWGSVARWVVCLCLAAAPIAHASSLTGGDNYLAEGIVLNLQVGLIDTAFTLDHHAARFVVADPQASSRLVDVLKTTERVRSSISVEFDPASGFMSENETMPTFVVKSITYQGQRTEAPPNAATTTPSTDPATTAFIRGVAEVEGSSIRRPSSRSVPRSPAHCHPVLRHRRTRLAARRCLTRSSTTATDPRRRGMCV